MRLSSTNAVSWFHILRMSWISKHGMIYWFGTLDLSFKKGVAQWEIRARHFGWIARMRTCCPTLLSLRLPPKCQSLHATSCHQDTMVCSPQKWLMLAPFASSIHPLEELAFDEAYKRVAKSLGGIHADPIFTSTSGSSGMWWSQPEVGVHIIFCHVLSCLPTILTVFQAGLMPL